MKLLGLTIENLRKIKMAELNLENGNLVQIRGRNGAGKSTVLLALEILFNGGKAIPEDVITHGEESAKIIGKIDDFTVKRIIKKTGEQVLSIEKDGFKRAKPQDFLNTISGKFLDPQWFSELESKDKRKVLMDCVGIDFDKIDAEIKQLETERTYKGREIKQLGEPVEVEKIESISINELLEQRKAIDEFNLKQNEATRTRKNITIQIENAENEIKEREEKIRILESQIEEKKKYIEKLNEDYNLSPEPEAMKSTEEIENKITNIVEINKKAAEYEKYLERKKTYTEKNKEYTDLTNKINDKRIEKDNMLTTHEMPIDGLKFNDSGLEYLGINDQNWSDAESLKISLAISAALSKDLKTLYIRRGESLDTKSLKEVEEFAKNNDCQVIIEIVDDAYNLKEDGVFYLEEGEIIKSES